MSDKKPSDTTQKTDKKPVIKAKEAPKDEIGGYRDVGLPEPTRYGDWESKGRCTDF